MDKIFKQKKLSHNKLIKHGFVYEGGLYSYTTYILDGQFQLTVYVAANNDVTTKCVDVGSGEEYVLHLLPNAEGAFVGVVREAIEVVLKDISEKCFDSDIFKSAQTNEMVKYVAQKYGDRVEFLWEDENGVWRRKDNNKWYGLLMSVKKSKFGFDSDEIVEILDVRADPDEIDVIVDDNRYFRGYHMNKKHWLTMILDGSVDTDEICRRIDTSYELAKKSK